MVCAHAAPHAAARLCHWHATLPRATCHCPCGPHSPSTAPTCALYSLTNSMPTCSRPAHARSTTMLCGVGSSRVASAGLVARSTTAVWRGRQPCGKAALVRHASASTLWATPTSCFFQNLRHPSTDAVTMKSEGVTCTRARSSRARPVRQLEARTSAVPRLHEGPQRLREHVQAGTHACAP